MYINRINNYNKEWKKLSNSSHKPLTRKKKSVLYKALVRPIPEQYRKQSDRKQTNNDHKRIKLEAFGTGMIHRLTWRQETRDLEDENYMRLVQTETRKTLLVAKMIKSVVIYSLHTRQKKKTREELEEKEGKWPVNE